MRTIESRRLFWCYSQINVITWQKVNLSSKYTNENCTSLNDMEIVNFQIFLEDNELLGKSRH